MKTKFEIETAIIKWAKENGHGGFYTDEFGDPCECKLSELAPCGFYERIVDGDCECGKLVQNYTDSNGVEYDWAIVPHDFDGATCCEGRFRNGKN